MIHGLIIQGIAAFFGTAAFALLYGTPGRYYPLCALNGGVGWVLMLFLQEALHLGVGTSTMAAAAAVTALARCLAIYQKCPVTVFLISGIIPLVPGAGVYWMAYYLIMGDLNQAAANGLSATKAAVAIVLGISVISELPYLHMKKKPDKNQENT